MVQGKAGLDVGHHWLVRSIFARINGKALQDSNLREGFYILKRSHS
jgi:hypothetical protein